MRDVLLKVEGITKRFGKHIVLRNISFSLYEGEILGIMGPSGVGKTTLLKVIIGFLKPEKGKVLYRHKASSNTSSSRPLFKSVFDSSTAFKDFFGFAAQTPSFYDDLTVLENLVYFGKLYRLSRNTLQANIKTLLRLMSLEEAKNVIARNLSGGMRRRLDIACALIHNPKLLILDEPTSDLDPMLREKIWFLIRKINEAGTTVILSSHFVNDLERVCSRVALLKNGKIDQIGDPSELKSRFSPGHTITLKMSTLSYERLINKLNKEFKKPVYLTNLIEKSNGIVEAAFICDDPLAMVNYIHQAVDEENDLLELRLKNPSLDQVFF